MKQFLFLLTLLLPLSPFAQNRFDYLKDEYFGEYYLGLSASYTMLSNNEAPFSANHKIKGWTANIDIRKSNWGLGEFKYLVNYKLLGDLFLILENQINSDGKKYYRSESSSITNGLLGWHAFAWGINKGEIVSSSVGFSLNDYFFGASYYEDSLRNKLITNEPQGYYFAAGPNLMVDVMLKKLFVLHIQSAYVFSYWRPVSLTYGIEDNTYPKPHFAQASIELMSPYGVFAAINYNQVINRGELPNNTKRIDLLVGFKFVL